MVLHPSECCYKAAPCPDYHGDTRLVVRLRDYQTAYDRIASLEAERDRLREMVRKLIPWTGACPDYFSDKDDCGKCEHCITRREAENYIAASIGGEEKP